MGAAASGGCLRGDGAQYPHATERARTDGLTGKGTAHKSEPVKVENVRVATAVAAALNHVAKALEADDSGCSDENVEECMAVREDSRDDPMDSSFSGGRALRRGKSMKRRLSLSALVGEQLAPAEIVASTQQNGTGSDFGSSDGIVDPSWDGFLSDGGTSRDVETMRSTEAEAVRDLMELSRFTPLLVLRHIKQLSDVHGSSGGGSIHAEVPSAESFPAIVLLADVSGFTKMAERLNAEGRGWSIRGTNKALEGAERMREILNVTFGKMVTEIVAAGGDVVKFAGDALIAIWHLSHEPRPGGVDQSSSPSSLTAETARAMQSAAHCALRLKNCFEDEGNPGSPSNFGLRLHSALAAGTVTTFFVGGKSGNWLHVPTGEPFAQLSRGIDLAQPGSLVCSKEAWSWLSLVPNIDIAAKPLRHGVLELVLGARTRTGPSSSGEKGVPTVYEDVLKKLLVGDVRGQASKKVATIAHAQAQEQLLRLYIPLQVQRIFEAGSVSAAELRHVTVVFLHTDPPMGKTNDEDQRARDLAQLQEATELLQLDVAHYEGFIKELTVDDKGLVLVVGFGVPPYAHEDDAARGTLAALALQRTFTERLSLPCRIGVTSGYVFVGTVGNKQRAEYSMIGSVVNLAARLMMANGRSSGIYTDDATHAAARNQVAFKPLPPIRVKGRDDEVKVYRPRWPGNSSKTLRSIRTLGSGSMGPLDDRRVGADLPVVEPMMTVILGRDSFLKDLETRVMQLTSAEGWSSPARTQSLAAEAGASPPASASASCSVILLEGDAGLGKTALLEWSSRLVQSQPPEQQPLRFHLDFSTIKATTSSEVLCQWGGLLCTLQLYLQQLDEEAEERMQESERRRGHLLRMLSHALASANAMEVRSATDDYDELFDTTLRELEQHASLLVQQCARYRSVLILVDGITRESCSQSAWKALEGLAQRCCASHTSLPVLLLLAARPLLAHEPGFESLSELRALAESSGGRHTMLEGLSMEATSALILSQPTISSAGACGVHRLAVAHFHERSEGVPSRIIELVTMAQQQGRLRVCSDGEDARLVASLRDPNALSQSQVPFTVRAQLMATNDRLTPDLLMALRVCAVVGVFTPEMIGGFEEATSTTVPFEQLLPVLERLGFVRELGEAERRVHRPLTTICARVFELPPEQVRVLRFSSLVHAEVTSDGWGLEHRRSVHLEMVDFARKCVRLLVPGAVPLNGSTGSLDEMDNLFDPLRNAPSFGGGGGEAEGEGRTPETLFGSDQMAEAFAKLEPDAVELLVACTVLVAHHLVSAGQYSRVTLVAKNLSHTVGAGAVLAHAVDVAQSAFGGSASDGYFSDEWHRAAPNAPGTRALASQWIEAHLELVPWVKGILRMREMQVRRRLSLMRGVARMMNAGRSSKGTEPSIGERETGEETHANGDSG